MNFLVVVVMVGTHCRTNDTHITLHLYIFEFIIATYSAFENGQVFRQNFSKTLISVLTLLVTIHFELLFSQFSSECSWFFLDILIPDKVGETVTALCNLWFIFLASLQLKECKKVSGLQFNRMNTR